MDQMTIRQKLYAVFGVIIGIFACVSVYSGYNLYQINNGAMRIATEHISREPNRWTQGAQMMKDALEQEGMHVDLYVFDTDESQKECLQKAVDSKPDCIVLAGGESKNFTKALADAK